MYERMPAGKYYIGDLCYAIEDWDAFCELTIKDEMIEGKLPWKGAHLWHHTTAYGDGCYSDQMGRKYSVDAGLIGVLPIEFADKEDYDLGDLGQVIDFQSPFNVGYQDGVFLIGHITIDTDPGAHEEEDIDYSDEDEYDQISQPY